MLKHRVICCFTFNDGVLTRTKRFQPDYIYTSSFLGSEHIDEVLLLDVTRGGPGAAA